MRTLKCGLLTIVLLAQVLTPEQAARVKLEIAKSIDALVQQPTISANLQAAINAAVSGAILQLAPSLNEPSEITINKPLTIVGNGATLNGGLTLTSTAQNVDLSGFTVNRLQDDHDVMILSGDGIKVTDVQVHGRAAGQHRGVLGIGLSHAVLRRVRVDGIQLVGQDAQAWACWDGCSDVLIEDSFLSGAGETVLIGGADAASQSRQPKNITIRGTSLGACVLTKDIAWRKVGPQVKTTLEFKNVSTFLVENCRIENAWQDAQGGYLITLTPRNQDGKNPWASVEHGIIRNNIGGNAAGFVNVLGTDNEKPSGLLSDITIDGNVMSGFDPSIWRASAEWGTDKLVQIIRGSIDFRLRNNTLSGAHIGSVVYFDELPKSQRMVVTGNVWPPSTYGVFGGNSAPGLAWAQYVDPIGSLLSGNTER